MAEDLKKQLQDIADKQRKLIEARRKLKAGEK